MSHWVINGRPVLRDAGFLGVYSRPCIEGRGTKSLKTVTLDQTSTWVNRSSGSPDMSINRKGYLMTISGAVRCTLHYGRLWSEKVSSRQGTRRREGSLLMLPDEARFPLLSVIWTYARRLGTSGTSPQCQTSSCRGSRQSLAELNLPLEICPRIV